MVLFYILRHFRSPIVLGLDGLLRIASGFVGLCQAVGVVGGRWGQEMFSKCGAEEWTSRNCPVFCVWTYTVLCVTDLSQICVPECIGPGLQPDCDQSIILVESN